MGATERGRTSRPRSVVEARALRRHKGMGSTAASETRYCAQPGRLAAALWLAQASQVRARRESELQPRGLHPTRESKCRVSCLHVHSSVVWIRVCWLWARVYGVTPYAHNRCGAGWRFQIAACTASCS